MVGRRTGFPAAMWAIPELVAVSPNRKEMSTIGGMGLRRRCQNQKTITKIGLIAGMISESIT